MCHKCDTPKCVNPEHLFVGTPGDNSDDKLAKMRHRKGEEIHWRKLNNEDIFQIRKMRESDGMTFQSIADQFKVSKRLIMNIVSRRTWKHI